jgi:hypothetical protein
MLGGLLHETKKDFVGAEREYRAGGLRGEGVQSR